MLFLLLLPVVLGSAAPGQAEAEPAPRPVVVAILDTGINPYHIEFRSNAQTNPLIEDLGVPITPVQLTLPTQGTPPFDATPLDQDSQQWNGLQPRTLYWFPGTNIMGAISFWPDDWTSDPDLYPWPLIFNQESDHGTHVASMCCGATLGTGENEVLVVVQAKPTSSHFAAAMEWIQDNRWIDFVGFQSGNAFGVHDIDLALAQAFRDYHEAGGLLAVASGNGNYAGGQVNFFSVAAGPPWVWRVGERFGEPATHTFDITATWPAEVIARTHSQVPKANTVTQYDESGGSSLATPTTLGHMANLLHEVRRTFNWPTDDCNCLAKGPAGLVAKGPLADGELTRDELLDIMEHTAVPAPIVYNTGLPGDMFTYGIVNETSEALARDVLFGRADPLDRPEADFWFAQYDGIRHAYWDDHPLMPWPLEPCFPLCDVFD